MKLYDDSSSVRAGIFILPRRFKKVSSRSWVLVLLGYLSSSWQVPNVPAWDHLPRVENLGKSVMKTTS